MSERYVVREFEGRLRLSSTGTNRPLGLTVSVHDTLMLWHVVALWRTEDMWRVPGQRRGTAPNSVRREHARKLARQLADELNRRCKS